MRYVVAFAGIALGLVVMAAARADDAPGLGAIGLRSSPLRWRRASAPPATSSPHR